MKCNALFPPEQTVKYSKSPRLMFLFIFTLNVLPFQDQQGVFILFVLFFLKPLQ